jgi:hypothetical protein
MASTIPLSHFAKWQRNMPEDERTDEAGEFSITGEDGKSWGLQ